MSTLGAVLYLADSLVFLLVGFIIIVRLKEAKGSLRLARISFFMAAFSAAGAFLITGVAQLIYDPLNTQSTLLVKQLYVPSNLFAMSVLAFLASFTLFATYGGGRRRLIVSVIFIVALIPTAYLALTYDQTIVVPSPPDYPDSYLLTLPPLTDVLFALCGIPLGVIPLLAFGRSFIRARKRGDKVLSQRAGMMLSSIVLNEVAYLLFVFCTGTVKLVTIVAWIPIELFLLFAVLKTTSPVRPEM